MMGLRRAESAQGKPAHGSDLPRFGTAMVAMGISRGAKIIFRI
jgi:hypothetical protein